VHTVIRQREAHRPPLPACVDCAARVVLQDTVELPQDGVRRPVQLTLPEEEEHVHVGDEFDRRPTGVRASQPGVRRHRGELVVLQKAANVTAALRDQRTACVGRLDLGE
jgi:hypothetical protein